MCLSSERFGRDRLCFRSSAEIDALILCRKVKVGVLKKGKEQVLWVFSVGLCSHHNFLPASRAGNPSSSTFCFLQCRILTFAAGHKSFVVYIQGCWEPQCPPYQVGTPITGPNVDTPLPLATWALVLVPCSISTAVTLKCYSSQEELCAYQNHHKLF